MDAIYYNSPQKNGGKKILLSLLFLFFLFSLAYGGFFAWKIYAVGKKISGESGSAPSLLRTVSSLADGNIANLKNSTPGRINILLLGIAGKGKPGQYLTDTIMIASINTETKQVALLSIPRDFYANLPELKVQRKINTLYQAGMINSSSESSGSMDLLLQAVKAITSLDMDYYAVLNFTGFEKAVNDIGGVNIMNERDIYDASYPGPNYSYEPFKLEKGFHHLDGATALKYARERHDDPQGDFGRAKRQQEVMQAAKNKIFSAATLFDPVALNNLLNTLGDNVVTNLSPDEIGSFLELSKKLDTQNITNVVLDAWNKDSLLKVSHIGGAFVLVPRVGNYSEVQELAQNIFDLDKLKRKRQAIAEEDANIAIIDRSGEPRLMEKIRKLLSENLDYKNISILPAPDKSLAADTVAYDLTNGTKPFTADELVAKLPAKISYSADTAALSLASGKKPDIVVVLGKDLAQRYNGEEATLEDLNNARDEEDNFSLQNK